MKHRLGKIILPAVGIPILSLCALSANAAGLTYSFANTFDTAVIDGSYTDWQPLASNVHVPMYIAGNPTKPVLSDLYLRYDCESETIFGLVLKQPNSNYSVVGNAWIKIYELGNSPRVDENANPPNGTQPEFSWVPPSASVQPNTEGYEASFSLTPGSYTLEAHLNIDNGSGSQTSSTGRGDYFINLNLTCPTESMNVSKTANPFYLENYDWTITKVVDPDSHTMFMGDAAQTSTYTVTVDQTLTSTGQKVTGTITIANSTTTKTAIIANVIDTITPGNIPIEVDCGATFPYTLTAGQTLTCSYTQTLASAFSGQNEVIVLPGNGSGLKGGRATANFSFGTSTPKETTGYPTVDVVDTKQGVLQTGLGGDKTFTYDTNFGCPTDPAQYVNGKYETTYDNTANVQKDTTVIKSASAAVKKTCYAPIVTKTANPSITQTLGWTLNKTVTPTTLSMNAGESNPVHYTVTVGTEVINTSYAVSGTITVANPNPSQSMTVPVTDVLAGGINATVDCGGSATLTVLANSSATCAYSTNLPDSATRLNTATATLNNIGFTGTATVNFNGVVPTVIAPTPSPASVTDTNLPAGSPWTTSGPMTQNYDETLTCSTNPADYSGGHYSFPHPNTAAIDGTDKSSTATVNVDCYAPLVSKTATTSFIRTHQWGIDKMANIGPNDILLQVGQTYSYTYDITVNVTGQNDTGVTVAGDITVQNPNPNNAMDVSVADALPDATNVTLACGSTLSVPAGNSASCHYHATLPDNSTGTNRTNVATVTLNGVDFNAQTAVTFGTPAQEKDTCVTVTDQIAANPPWTAAMNTAVVTLGTVCVSDSLPKVFSYPLTAGPYDAATASACQLPNNPASLINNTATYTVTDNSSVSGTAEEHVPVCVPQNDSCTLTQGYWKTHSIHGKAPESEGWIGTAPTLVEGQIVNQEGNIADMIFFFSGKTYYQVLWTPPQGNAYYNLAHQWIATYLNQMNGASMPADVTNAFMQGWTLLATYAPNQVSGNVAKQFKALYPVLGSYNNGLIGPGHCSNDSILFGE